MKDIFARCNIRWLEGTTVDLASIFRKSRSAGSGGYVAIDYVISCDCCGHRRQRYHRN